MADRKRDNTRRATTAAAEAMATDQLGLTMAKPRSRPDAIGVVWFRRDLRLDDNPAWAAASSHNEKVLALFVIEERLLASTGPYRRDLLWAHLEALDRDLEAFGGGSGGLTVRTGPAEEAVPALLDELGASNLYYNVDYSGFARRRDREVEQRAKAIEATVHRHHGNVIHEPGTVLTKAGTLSQVFTPFYRRWTATALPVWPEPGSASVVRARSDQRPRPEGTPYQPGGETEAWIRLNRWLDQVDDYPETRDVPGIEGTSRLSADLRFGTLAARSVLDAVGTHTAGREAFVRQLAWRDWWAHTLDRQPDLTRAATRREYDAIAWSDPTGGLEAWKEGRTGYPLVDAGMRQLASTGWMHNRVRMVCAGFLVKDLLIDWRLGERHFRRLLVDGEPSQNAGNWQWAAGTGPDAAPYFRIFNPISQSRKFDPRGDYLRRWIPELAALDNDSIHEPWSLGPLELAAAGVTLGDDYPHRIVDHRQARERTLAAYKAALGTDTP